MHTILALAPGQTCSLQLHMTVVTVMKGFIYALFMCVATMASRGCASEAAAGLCTHSRTYSAHPIVYIPQSLRRTGKRSCLCVQAL